MALTHTRVAVTADDPAADVKMSDWNAEHVVDGDGLLMASDTTVPAAPAAGYLTLFGKSLAGGMLPAFIGPSGLDSTLQPFFGRNRVAMWMACGGTTTAGITAIGIFAPQAVGTAAVRSFNSASYFASLRRIGYASAATAGATTAIRTTLGQFWRGNAGGLGGFRFVARFGCSDAATVAGARSFYGLQSLGTSGNVDPSTFVNSIGIGTDAGDATFSIMHNDASGSATKVALGANFPDHTLSVDMYELAIFAPPNASYVNWEVTRLNTGHTASGQITTDLPASTQSLMPHFFRNNGATALAVAFDFCNLYIETDN